MQGSTLVYGTAGFLAAATVELVVHPQKEFSYENFFFALALDLVLALLIARHIRKFLRAIADDDEENVYHREYRSIWTPFRVSFAFLSGILVFVAWAMS